MCKNGRRRLDGAWWMVDGVTLWGCPKVESEEMQVLGLWWDRAVVQSEHIFGYFRKDG